MLKSSPPSLPDEAFHLQIKKRSRERRTSSSRCFHDVVNRLRRGHPWLGLSRATALDAQWHQCRGPVAENYHAAHGPASARGHPALLCRTASDHVC